MFSYKDYHDEENMQESSTYQLIFYNNPKANGKKKSYIVFFFKRTMVKLTSLFTPYSIMTVKKKKEPISLFFADLAKCSISSLTHQWILCNNLVKPIINKKSSSIEKVVTSE